MKDILQPGIHFKHFSNIFQHLKPESPTVVRWKNSLPLTSFPAQAANLGDKKEIVRMLQFQIGLQNENQKYKMLKHDIALPPPTWVPQINFHTFLTKMQF